MRAFAKYMLTRWMALPLALLLAFGSVAYAQYYEGTPPPPPPAYAPTQAPPAFSQQDLDQMLAPIALYPDPLLSQILMAATYPMEVVESARWSRANPNFMGDDAVRAAQQMHWDPSIISLVAFPQILQMMDDKLDWTERLGDAFLAQEPQLMDTVQNLRQRAYAAGNLRSNDQIMVEPQGQIIAVEPANPEIIYVPYYDPTVVYGSWWWPDYPPVYWEPWDGYYPGSGFALGFAWGSGIPVGAGFFFGDFDWHHHRANVVNVNNYYYNHNRHHDRDNEGRTNAAPGTWQHDPDHRRGVIYRDESLRQQYSRASTAHEARGDFRGYDQSPPGNSGASGNRQNAAGSTTVLPDLPNTRGTPGRRPDTRTADPRQFVGGGSASRPYEPRAQVRPNPPMAVSRPTVEVRPHAFEGIERGADVQIHSSRGRASFEGAAHSQNNTPPQQPFANAPASNSPGANDRQQHKQIIEQSHDNNRDTTRQRKP